MDNALVSTSFKVADVSVATKPRLPLLPYHVAVSDFLRKPVESCSRYHGQLLANVVSHPLIAALHGAFALHQPITLSPDIIWLTIAQGLATHIKQNAESLRSKFVRHDGKLTIEVFRDDFIKGSPENPWPEVFSAISEQVRNHIGDSHELIVADFSTTRAVERAASEVVLLDSMQSYFDYEVISACGIPAITLEGTVADWESIASRTERFSEFGLGWWIDSLRPILKQFVAAAAGHIDRDFWDSIYKFNGPKGSGSFYVSGWVNNFFPYLRQGFLTTKPNQWIGAPPSRNGPSRAAFPNTTSKAPFKWNVGLPPNNTTYEMEFIGGLIGVAQCPDTLALRPEIGWAVRDTAATKASDKDHRIRSRMDSLL